MTIVNKIERELLNEQKILDFIYNGKKLIKNVVINGTEPCLQKDLITFVPKLKSWGFKVPKILRFITGIYNNIEDVIINIYNSIKILKDGNIDHEFRITLIRETHSFNDLCDIISHCTSSYKLPQ